MSEFASDRLAVELVPHDPAWLRMATEEGARLAAALGDVLIRVEHVGSTAIPGIEAKPIVDLIPVVHSLDALDAKRPAIEALGYVWRGEFGIPRRRYCFREENGSRLFQLHCFADGEPETARMLAFRDYLRAHPQEARDYESQKRAAAAANPDNTLAYNDHKSVWMAGCIDRAMAWAATR